MQLPTNRKESKKKFKLALYPQMQRNLNPLFSFSTVTKVSAKTKKAVEVKVKKKKTKIFDLLRRLLSLNCL